MTAVKYFTAVLWYFTVVLRHFIAVLRNDQHFVTILKNTVSQKNTVFWKTPGFGKLHELRKSVKIGK